MGLARTRSSLPEAVLRASGREEHGFWLRTVTADAEAEARNILESALHGGRVNPPHAFPVLYLSERQRNYGAYVCRSLERENGKVPAVIVATLEVSLERILDLSSASIRNTLGVTYGELTDSKDMSVPQAVGAAAYRAEFGGIIYPRPSSGGRRNLAIFLERVKPDSLRVLSAIVLS